MTNSTDTGALSGLRVIDLSSALAGPYCSMLLADYGAEVIKIEQPGVGDGSRHWGPPWQGGESAYFLSANRNKKSMTLNLKKEQGREILKKLLQEADVLLENFKPGTMARFGLDYEALKDEHPGLIFCSISGFGQDGPYRDRPGYDFMIQAQGGIMSITGPEDGQPSKVGVAIVDISTGLFACNAILAALHHREKTGLGQYIDVALLDAQVAWLANVAHNYFATGETPQRYGNAHASIVPYESFQTADSWIALAIAGDQQYQRFCEAVERPDLGQDARFQSNSGRVQHREELIPRLQALLRERTTAQWLALLAQINVPAGAINDIPGALNHPQIQHREMVQEIEHPSAGKIKQLGPVAKLSRTPAAIISAPPLLGADTVSVLLALGYTRVDIERLTRDDVL